MPARYDSLRYYARGGDQEQAESPAAGLQFYAMVSNKCHMRVLLTVPQLRDISLELDRDYGDVMRWQYGAAEALNFICVLHGGDEGVARVVVASRYVLHCWLRAFGVLQGGSNWEHVAVDARRGWGGSR